MNHYFKYYFLSLGFFPMVTSCDKNSGQGDKVKSNEQRAVDTVEGVIPSSLVELDRNVFDKEFIDSNLIMGLPQDKVEKIIGPAYKYNEFKGTIRADYRLSDPGSKGLRMVGFTVVYKDEKLYSVDESWLGIHSKHGINPRANQ